MSVIAPNKAHPNETTVPRTRIGEFVDRTVYRVRPRPKEPGARSRSRLKIAGAGYLVLLIFAVCFVLLNDLNARWRGAAIWPQLSRLEVIVAAVLVAAPAALAFIWDRLSMIRLPGLEVSLATAAPATNELLRDEIKDAQRFPLGGSGYPDIKKAIGTATGDLIEINLGETQWWSTRLFLLAALTEEYTIIKQLVFVDRCDNLRVCFVGMSTPAATRRALAAVHPDLEQFYRSAKSNVALPVGGLSVENEVELVIGNLWGNVASAQKVESQMRQLVTADWLHSVMKSDLTKPIVDWPGRQTGLLQYLILASDAPFVAIVQGTQLIQVVDRCALATLISSAALKTQLEG